MVFEKSIDKEIAEFTFLNTRNKVLNNLKFIGSDYFQKYIKRIFKNNNTIFAELLKYKKLISLIKINLVEEKNCSIIDLGGCHGYLSYLLGRYFDCKVIMIEPFEESVANCEILWKNIKNNNVSFLNLNYKTLIPYLKKNKTININYILSYDVIEHVGSIEDFFNYESILSKANNIHFIHASSANPYNLRNKLRDIKNQILHEYFGNKYKGMKSTSSNESYFISRLNFYRKNKSYKKYFLGFKSIIFAILTRGLTKKEIKKSLNNSFSELFLSYIKQINKIGFFNTIDIKNDSWMERHHNLKYLKKILISKKFKNIKFIPTKYIYVKNDFSSKIKAILNDIIDLLPNNKLKLLFSPEIIITYNN